MPIIAPASFASAELRTEETSSRYGAGCSLSRAMMARTSFSVFCENASPPR
jgi:hypothetical protein